MAVQTVFSTRVGNNCQQYVDKMSIKSVTYRQQAALHIKQEVHYIAVLSHIFLSFDGHFARLTHSCLGAERNEVVVLYDFGADKAFLKVSVDNSRTFRSLGAAEESPRAHLVGAGGEECLKVEQGVTPDSSRPIS